MTTFTATYSPDDNKLRLSASQRLDAETFARVKANGFKWAPKQEQFIAPMWTPGREDLLIELAGEIGDEDSTLLDRAEQRAERFENYSDKRMADAERARTAVEAIAEHIPFGQPILVGHHSERHARRDAEKIENGMRKAVNMWKTSQYWTGRAAGAIAHAKYKELPAVRHRRIKKIEAEQRRAEKSKAYCDAGLRLWTECGKQTDEALQRAMAMRLANSHGLSLPRKEGDNPALNQCPSAYNALTNGFPNLYVPRTLAEIVECAQRVYPRSIERYSRWLEHYGNRLAYERAMLAEQLGADTGTANAMAERFAFAVGGEVLADKEWLIILRVNRKDGVVNSVTTTAPRSVTWSKSWKYGVERIKDYRAPTAAQAEQVKAATKLPPICNYPGEGFREMTDAEWKARGKWSDFPYIGGRKATEKHGAHRARQMPVPGKMWEKQQVFITDAKRIDPPAIKPPTEPADAAEFVAQHVAPPTAAADHAATAELDTTLEAVAEAMEEPRAVAPPVAADFPAPSPTADFEAMARSLKAGVQVVTAPQLFPTPATLAAEMVDLAEIQPSHDVLEPSGGTGAIIRAIRNGCKDASLVAVEIKPHLADIVRSAYRTPTHCADFLDCTAGRLGTFDRIVMNPPFERGSDIRHIEHARTLLKPGGRIVAICADGPRQREKLQPLASVWRSLPAGTFKESGTNVNTALLVIDG